MFRKELVDPLYEKTLANAIKGHNDLPLEIDLVRKIPKPMVLSTAQLRTQENMFGWVAHASLTDPSNLV